MGSCVSSHAKKSLDLTKNIGTVEYSSSASISHRKGSKRWKKKYRERERKNANNRSASTLDLESLEKLNEVDLQKIPGRLFTNGRSDVACLFTQQGRKGLNQDAMIVWENFGSRRDTILCGVYDGHGPLGHLVAQKVRDILPLKLNTHWKDNTTDQNSLYAGDSISMSMNSEETASIIMDDEWAESIGFDDFEKPPEMYYELKKSILKSFKLMDKELKLHPTIDCFCSGSTAVTLVKQGNNLVIANIGDSRAILGRREDDNSLIAIQLTVDLKPNLPREAARIQQCRGRVFALQDEPEVARVWLPNSDSPGLAMARAFGDFCLKDFGLISVPDISYRRLTEKDEFIVLSTDGVWDVLSNKEVVDIVSSAPNRGSAARSVVDCAVRAWRLKFPTSKIDDCAVVCLFLDHTSQSCEIKDARRIDTEKTNDDGELIVSELRESNMENDKPFASTSENKESDKTENLLVVDKSLLDVSNAEGIDEIVPVPESTEMKIPPERCRSTRSLAECISTSEEEEWSALEGITRVNSLLNLPRSVSGGTKAASWKKWL